MKNKTTLNTRYKLDIEVLSPVAINDGGTLSPLVDYFVSEGELHYVDEQEFQKLLAEDELVANRYEQQLVKTSKDGADGFLPDVIQSKEKLYLISNGKKVQFNGEKTLGFKTIVKSNGKAYIPGSSLKGAIKNAYLFYWLEKEVEGQKELALFIKDFKNRNDHKDKEKTIQRFVDVIQKKAFGIKDGYLYQPSSHLMLSDSSVLEFSDMAVANVTKQSLKERIEDWDLHTQEYIKIGAKLSFVLNINNMGEDWKDFNPSNAFVSLMNKSQEDLTEFFGVLNYYHNSLEQFIDGFDVEKHIVHVNSNEAILYVGGNKGIYKTTVLLAIRKYCENNGHEFFKLFGDLLQRKKAKGYQDFPNSLSHINGQRLGMLRIRDLNNDRYIQVSDKRYDELDLKSGNAVEGILQNIGKPNSKVLVVVDGEEKEFLVGGAKAVLKERSNALQIGNKCVFYWRDNNYYFTK